MRKLFAIFCLIILSVLAVVFAEKNGIVGARVNNQLLLSRGHGQLSDGLFRRRDNLVRGFGNVRDCGLCAVAFQTRTGSDSLDSRQRDRVDRKRDRAFRLGPQNADRQCDDFRLRAHVGSGQDHLGSRAASGANSDITSLTGLTTALPVAQGGTGAGTAAVQEAASAQPLPERTATSRA